MDTPQHHQRRGQRQLLLLAALFFVPLAVAFYLYYGAGTLRPAGSVAKGELLEPARPLPEVSLPRPGHGATDTGFLRGKWDMIYIGDGACDARCREALYLTRQSRIALNKDMDRVQRVFLVTGHCCDEDFLAREHPDLLIARLDGEAGGQLLAPFPVYDGIPAAEAGRIYLVDPLGNLVLSYAATAPDKALLTDVKKLLRLSHIG
jgi:hypothetical protein